MAAGAGCPEILIPVFEKVEDQWPAAITCPVYGPATDGRERWPSAQSQASGIYNIFKPEPTPLQDETNSPSNDFIALKAVQAMTPIFAFLQIILVLKTLALFSKPRAPSLLATAFVVFLPMQIYVSSFISNEMFASLMVSASLFLLISMVDSNTYGICSSLLFGAIMAIACLSKYTGLLIFTTACLVYFVVFLSNSADRQKVLRSLFLISVVVMSLAGPFYYRNLRHYGRILPINQELLECRSLGYRELGFYVNPSFIGTGALDKFVGRTISSPRGQLFLSLA